MGHLQIPRLTIAKPLQPAVDLFPRARARRTPGLGRPGEHGLAKGLPAFRAPLEERADHRFFVEAEHVPWVSGQQVQPLRQVGQLRLQAGLKVVCPLGIKVRMWRYK